DRALHCHETCIEADRACRLAHGVALIPGWAGKWREPGLLGIPARMIARELAGDPVIGIAPSRRAGIDQPPLRRDQPRHLPVAGREAERAAADVEHGAVAHHDVATALQRDGAASRGELADAAPDLADIARGIEQRRAVPDARLALEPFDVLHQRIVELALAADIDPQLLAVERRIAQQRI